MDITITKGVVIDKVIANVGVFARDATDKNGNSLYDILRIEDRDDTSLSLMWKDAAGRVMGALGEYVTAKSDDKITVEQPFRCNDAQFLNVAEMAELAMVDRITAMWFELKYPEKADIFNLGAKTALESARDKLHMKGEPTLKTYGKNASTDGASDNT